MGTVGLVTTGWPDSHSSITAVNPFALPWETTLAAAIQNTLASSTIMAAHLNDELTRRYLSAFDSWETMVLAGKISNANPPEPPAGYYVAKTDTGFSYPELGNVAVCEMPAIPEDHSKPQPPVVVTGNDRVMNVPPGDTAPVGYIATAPDGSRWQKQTSQTPFGLATFYVKL